MLPGGLAVEIMSRVFEHIPDSEKPERQKAEARSQEPGARIKHYGLSRAGP